MGRAHDDETHQRRLEMALQQSEERFERLVEAAKDYAIFMTDVDGRVTTWNEGAHRLFGYGEAEIVGEDASIPFTSEDRESGLPIGNWRKPELRAEPRTSAGTCARTALASGPAVSSGPF
jgi:PAS domain-containing protein